MTIYKMFSYRTKMKRMPKEGARHVIFFHFEMLPVSISPVSGTQSSNSVGTVSNVSI